MFPINFVCVLYVLFLYAHAQEFRFASIYQDHMVLQRAPSKAKLWGYAEEGASVSLNLFGKQYVTIASPVTWSNLSVWKIVLNPVEADGQPVTIEVSQTSQTRAVSKIQLNDVLFGDVWLCGGQSNMEWWLIKSIGGIAEINSGASYSNIRLFQVGKTNSTDPLNDVGLIQIPWSLTSPVALQKFSGVCWYYGKELNQRLNIPIGLIQSTYSGTYIEKWLSPESISICGVENSTVNSMHWNSMIKPLHSLSIYGIVWYQGESNRDKNLHLYNCTFPSLVNDWRNKWFIGTEGSTNSNFPFGFVQLANSNRTPAIGGLPWLRFHQTADFGYSPNPQLKNVFMASAIDLVDNYENPTHPRYKEDVGKRLSLGAFNLAYQIPVEYAAPKVTDIFLGADKNSSIQIKFGPVSRLKFSFSLKQNNDNGFEVCCDSSNCYEDQNNNWQPLSFTAYNMNECSLTYEYSPSNCTEPMYVRYLWREKPCEFKQCPWYSISPELPILPFIKNISKNDQYR